MPPRRKLFSINKQNLIQEKHGEKQHTTKAGMVSPEELETEE